ncbi:alpha/beta hydrolase-fold protein [Streptomyces sp. NPDC048361]|uniref:alpha/beta hydrolase n=1 Tax=Streptomyces sp. NPDC048361 TaxID=3154720 RepID=UPI0034233674
MKADRDPCGARRGLLRVKAVLAAAASALLLLGAPAAHAAHTAAPAPAPPVLADGFGLTQVGTATGSATNFVITVKTAEVAQEHHIRILLPAGYADEPTQRYPVFYFLHGASDDPANPFVAYPALTRSTAMITVIPDGGLRGWYTNWLDQNTAAGAQNWENFHINQVIPFIDANLRTLASRQTRAVGGLSMGGFGALHYAQRHPDLFGQVATFSGADDLSVDHMVMRGAVVATLTNAGAPLCGNAATTVNAADTGTAANAVNAVNAVNASCSLTFGPTVSSDAIFGTPYPVFDADWRWNEADPSAHMAALAGTGIAIYTGNGNSDPSAMEFWVESAAQHAKDHLDALKLPYDYVDYGNGSTWGAACHGGHESGCWAQDLVDYVPRLEAAFAAATR